MNIARCVRYRCRSLIENAIRYGERARITLVEQADSLHIQIDDDGSGIAESDQERVFEPFVRLETSRSLETGGVGLGLAIARSIVRRHGGDVALKNRQSGGLQATMILPKAHSGIAP